MSLQGIREVNDAVEFVEAKMPCRIIDTRRVCKDKAGFLYHHLSIYGSTTQLMVMAYEQSAFQASGELVRLAKAMPRLSCFKASTSIALLISCGGRSSN
jgi:hypothetical protein